MTTIASACIAINQRDKISCVTGQTSTGKGKGTVTGQVIGELGGIKIWEIHGACSRAPNTCMQFYVTAWHLGKVGRGRNKNHNQIKTKRGTNEVTWTRGHLGLVKLFASDERLKFFFFWILFRRGTAQKHHLNQFLCRKNPSTPSFSTRNCNSWKIQTAWESEIWKHLSLIQGLQIS